MKENSSWLRAEPENKMQRETGWRKNRPDTPAEPDDNIHRDRMKEKSSWLPAEPETKCRERPDEGKIVLIAGRTRWQKCRTEIGWRKNRPGCPAETRGSSTERGWMKKNRPGCLQNQTTKCRTNTGWCKTRPDKMRKIVVTFRTRRQNTGQTRWRKNRPAFNKMQNQRTKCRDRTKKKNHPDCRQNQGKIQRPDENRIITMKISPPPPPPNHAMKPYDSVRLQDQRTKCRERPKEGKIVLIAGRTRGQNAERDRTKKNRLDCLQNQRTKCRERPNEGKIVLICRQNQMKKIQRPDENK